MRSFLLILISFVAFTALTSGLVMISDPSGTSLGLPAEILNTTPFKNYLIPGVLLALFVGALNLLAFFMMATHHYKGYVAALNGGIILIIWILGQILLIGIFHWLYGVYLFIGVLISLISYQLMGKAAF